MPEQDRKRFRVGHAVRSDQIEGLDAQEFRHVTEVDGIQGHMEGNRFVYNEGIRLKKGDPFYAPDTMIFAQRVGKEKGLMEGPIRNISRVVTSPEFEEMSAREIPKKWTGKAVAIPDLNNMTKARARRLMEKLEGTVNTKVPAAKLQPTAGLPQALSDKATKGSKTYKQVD